jgi:hypothetical protein
MRHAITIETHSEPGEPVHVISWRWACSCKRHGRWQTGLTTGFGQSAIRRARNGGTAHRAAQDRRAV